FPGSTAKLGWHQPKVRLLPTFYFPDANGEPEPVTDSSPVIVRLESMFPQRNVIPTDPVLAMLDRLLEDYADEWLTKPMFHYRWNYDEDIQRSSEVLPHWRWPGSSDDFIRARGQEFATRQISRLEVVGSNEVTKPVIEQSFRRLITLLNSHFSEHRFLMGARPGASDFAFFGQLTCLVQFDPTPMALSLSSGGRLFAWVSTIEDLSGCEPNEADWLSVDALPGSVNALLSEMGRTYVPVMLANEAAIRGGNEIVQAQVDGLTWTQKPFSYQAKCLAWLRNAAAGLSANDKRRLQTVVDDTGVDALFE
ncbi:MAG: hypothetical protein WBD51_15805, partial [Burkholderiaceae bacterium]